uniref:Xylanase inhibitor C-terminal domain-containing protein n=1 Tax=Oryza brachyantha TaxID=4533 RepID=J3LBV0_ORYBR
MTGAGVSSTYNVHLLGISIDRTRLPIPDGMFVLDPKTGHGDVTFGTSTPVTLLVDLAYNLIVEVFMARMLAAASMTAFNGTRRLCFLVDPGVENIG